jgi:hypothetical protein
MSFSDYLENAVLDHVFKGGALGQPANLYVSLHSGDPGETGINELAGGGYARKNHNTWNAAAAGIKTNNGVITFVTATGDWLNATHFGIWDDPGAGNFLGGGSITVPKVVFNGDTAQFATTVLHITLD